MPDILRPDKSSRENILLFLDIIEDADLRKLMIDNLEHILGVGADQDQNRNHRNSFFQAIEQLIETKSSDEK
jgi:hypothetical protein